MTKEKFIQLNDALTNGLYASLRVKIEKGIASLVIEYIHGNNLRVYSERDSTFRMWIPFDEIDLDETYLEISVPYGYRNIASTRGHVTDEYLEYLSDQQLNDMISDFHDAYREKNGTEFEPSMRTVIHKMAECYW